MELNGVFNGLRLFAIKAKNSLDDEVFGLLVCSLPALLKPLEPSLKVVFIACPPRRLSLHLFLPPLLISEHVLLKHPHELIGVLLPSCTCFFLVCEEDLVDLVVIVGCLGGYLVLHIVYLVYLCDDLLLLSQMGLELPPTF